MKILIPVDDYLFSEAIINFIANHRWKDDDSFHLIHVIEPVYMGATPDVSYLDIIEQANSNYEELAKEMLTKAKNKLQELFPKMSITFQVYKGNIKETIFAEIKKSDIKLVICGSHGSKGFKRFFLGSVSLALVTSASCSVLIIKPSTYLIDRWESLSDAAKIVTQEYLAEPIEQKPLTVLLAIEESSTSNYIIDIIKEHNWLPNTVFKLLHVVESPMIGSPLAPSLLLSEASEPMIDSARKLLESKAQIIRTALPSITVHTDVVEGACKEAILDYANKINADLIILGSHGKSVMERFFIGSVSMAVLTSSQASCLVIRPIV